MLQLFVVTEHLTSTWHTWEENTSCHHLIGEFFLTMSAVMMKIRKKQNTKWIEIQTPYNRDTGIKISYLVTVSDQGRVLNSFFSTPISLCECRVQSMVNINTATFTTLTSKAEGDTSTSVWTAGVTLHEKDAEIHLHQPSLTWRKCELLFVKGN